MVSVSYFCNFDIANMWCRY